VEEGEENDPEFVEFSDDSLAAPELVFELVELSEDSPLTPALVPEFEFVELSEDSPAAPALTLPEFVEDKPLCFSAPAENELELELSGLDAEMEPCAWRGEL